ncbi:hypothetical protein D3C78_1569230 [compost metagenome]
MACHDIKTVHMSIAIQKFTASKLFRFIHADVDFPAAERRANADNHIFDQTIGLLRSN